MPDSPINYDVLFRWEAADGLAEELAARGEATVIAELLEAIAARFTAEHTTGVRFSVPELEEPETEGSYPAPNAEMEAEEMLQQMLGDMAAIDNLYRATRRFGQEWEDEPRKALGLHSVRVREAFEELSAAAAELGGAILSGRRSGEPDPPHRPARLPPGSWENLLLHAPELYPGSGRTPRKRGSRARGPSPRGAPGGPPQLPPPRSSLVRCLALSRRPPTLPGHVVA